MGVVLDVVSSEGGWQVRIKLGRREFFGEIVYEHKKDAMEAATDVAVDLDELEVAWERTDK